MAGNTSTINVAAFAADWGANIPITQLCVRWTVTKDQVYRLRDVWQLPLRLDRRLRAKPPRQPKPTKPELAASEATLALSPMVAARAAEVRAGWSDVVYLQASRGNRQGSGEPQRYEIPEIPVPGNLRMFLTEEA